MKLNAQSQILAPVQARAGFDRSQPGSSMKKGWAGTMTNDHIRHRAATLFAPANVLDVAVISWYMARHRHQEFIRFLDRLEVVVPLTSSSTPSSITASPTGIRRPASPEAAMHTALAQHSRLEGRLSRIQIVHVR
jgi:hypothetical protein